MKTELTEYGAYTGNHLYLFLIKNIFKTLIKKICKPFIYTYYIIKFHNIWNLKKHLLKKNKESGLLSSYYYEYFNKLSSYVGLSSKFEDIPCFPHSLFGIFISNNAKIGKNCVIFHQVTIGSNTLNNSKNFGSPTIGDNVYIGAGAKIIGNVKIGNNCRIGANTTVTTDMPDNTLAISQPTKYVNKENMDNRFIIVGKRNKLYYDNGKYVKLEVQNEDK